MKPYQVDERARVKEIIGPNDTSRAAIAYAYLAMNKVVTNIIQLTEMMYQMHEAGSLKSAFTVTTRSKAKQHLTEPIGRQSELQGIVDAAGQPEPEGRHVEPHGDDV